MLVDRLYDEAGLYFAKKHTFENLEIQGFFPTVTIFTPLYYVGVPMDSWDMKSVPMQKKG